MVVGIANDAYAEYNFFNTKTVGEDEEVEGWFSEDAQKPYVGHLIYKAVEFRNGSPGYDMGLLEKFARRVIVGELLFGALIVATLVENVARVALCLIAALPLLLCCEDGAFDTAMKIMVKAIIATPDFIIRCLSGIVINPFFGDDMTFEDLTLCKMETLCETCLAETKDD